MRQKTLMELARMRKDVLQGTMTMNEYLSEGIDLMVKEWEPNYDVVSVSDLKEGDRYRKPGKYESAEAGWTLIRSIHPCSGSHWRTHVVVNDSLCHDTRAKVERRKA